MSKNNGKRGRGSKVAIEHGVQSSMRHWIHSQQSKARQNRIYVGHEILTGEGYPKFTSNLSKLGEGRNWMRERRELCLTTGDAWVDKVEALAMKHNWYHQRMRTKIKKGENQGETKIRYAKRKVKDRKRLSVTDKRSRPDTDLMRETIDLRPDHSKVLEYLVSQGLTAELEPMLDKIRQKQLELFEQIYEGRKVVAVGEHVDAGQYHCDYWHTGIDLAIVVDHGAVVELVTEEGKNNEDERVLIKGKGKVVRDRQVFRSFGVGDGMASFDRHRSALEDEGVDAQSIMGYAHEKLLGNIDLVTERNKTRQQEESTTQLEDISNEDAMPRDIRLWRQVDAFVDSMLRELDKGLCDKARKEYTGWLQKGYKLGKLGISEEPLQVTKHKKRKKELEKLKVAIRVFLKIITKIPGVSKLLLKKDSLIAKKIMELVDMVKQDKEPSHKAEKGSKDDTAKKEPSIGDF